MVAPKICAWCEDSFIPPRKETKTCSRRCGARLRETIHPSPGHKRDYPPEIVELVTTSYAAGMTVKEIQDALPRGFKAQLLIERYVPQRRAAAKRHQTGSANHAWKGSEAGYEAAHWRVKSVHGPARRHRCVDCGNQARDWSYCGGDPNALTCPDNGCEYSLDISYYAPRCVPCHRAHDVAARKAARGVMPNA